MSDDHGAALYKAGGKISAALDAIREAIDEEWGTSTPERRRQLQAIGTLVARISWMHAGFGEPPLIAPLQLAHGDASALARWYASHKEKHQ